MDVDLQMLVPGGMIMAIVLSVVFAFAAISLAWRLLSDRRASAAQLARLQFEIDSRQFTIDLAKRLLNAILIGHGIRLANVERTPGQQRSLAAFLDHQDAPEGSEADLEPLPPPGSGPEA